MERSGYSQSTISNLIREGLTTEEIIERGIKYHSKVHKNREIRDTKNLAKVTGYSESTISQYRTSGLSDLQIIERSKKKRITAKKRKKSIQVRILSEYTGYCENTIYAYLRKGLSMEDILIKAEDYKKPSNILAKRIAALKLSLIHI